MALHSVEVCAGAGGQALGLEVAGFKHSALVENDRDCCQTLRLNRPKWNVVEQDLNGFDGTPYVGADLFAGGLPCPPFSVAGKQLGSKDERNLFPAALRIIDEMRPRAIMIENVRGFLGAVFEDYREQLRGQLKKLGYTADWRLLNAADFGVSQLRPRVVIVAVQNEISDKFDWPQVASHNPPSVGELLYDLMSVRGWRGAREWKKRADEIAPTIVGGSKKHGGPDLGPTRAKQAWSTLSVDGMGVADLAPGPNDSIRLKPKLTVRMVARLQGFPDLWQFHGRKTASYRQVGNAFPAPVAHAVALKLKAALTARRSLRVVA